MTMNRMKESGNPLQRGGAVAAAITLLAIAAAGADPLPVAELKRTDPVNFATEVYPFLRANCLACHNSTKAKAELILESPKDMLKGGDTGPAIVPGKADDSLLFTTSAHIEEPTMPPANNKSKAKDLTPEQLALLKLWIDQGAKGDAVSSAAPESWTFLKGPQPIYSAAFSSDGRFAVAGRGQQLHVYDLRLGELVASLRDPAIKDPVAHHDVVHSVAFSPDGRIASGGFREAKIWQRSAASSTAPVALPGEAASIAVSGDAKRAAIGAADGTIVIIALDQPADAKPVTVKDHAGAVTGLAFSPDHATLFSVSADKTVKRRPVADPAKAVSLALPAPAVAVALLDGGKRVAIAGADQTIRLCAADLAPPAAPAAPKPAAAPAAPAPAVPAPAAPAPAAPAPAAPAPAAPAPAVAPSPFVEAKPHTSPLIALATANAAGTEFLAAHEDGTVVHLKLDPAKPATAPTEVRRIAHGAPIKQIAVSSSGRLATAGVAGPVSLWNLADGAKVTDLKGDPSLQPRIDALNAESAIATRLKTYWGVQGPEAEKLWKAEADKAKLAGDEIAKARRDIVVKRADLRKLETQLPAAKPEDVTKAAEALAAAERTLTGAIRNRDLSARLAGDSFAKQTSAIAGGQEADATIAALKAEVEALQKLIAEQDTKTLTPSIAFSPDGTTLAQGLADGTVRLRAATTGAWLEDVPAAGAVQSLAYAGTSRLLTARAGKTAQVWTLPGAAWSLAKTLGDGKAADPFIDRVTAVAFSPDGTRLATGTGVPSRSGQIRLWDTTAWTVTASNDEAHGDTLTSFVFSPAGDRIASGATDRLVKVFAVETLAQEQTFEGHTNHVLDVDWNADGLTIASAGADLQVKIWDLAEGQQKSKVEGYEKEVGSVAYVGGTDTLLTASGDKTLKLANAPLPEAGDTFLHAAAASADGKLIISGGQDSVLRVHDAVAKKLVKAFPSPEAGKENVAAAK
jgi:WD40 repeat protein